LTYSIRRMVKEDLAQVPEDDSRTAPFPRPRGLDRLTAWLKKLRGSRSVHDVPSSWQYIVGFSGIWLLTDEAHITNIAVRQAYQGKGLGELLLIATIDLARELDASTLTLEVRASNEVAQNLYRKYGFTASGVRRGYYLDNREDGIIMTTNNIKSDAFRARLGELRDALARKLR
jgi:ribosomal-protein-alanine N-acetyltransferase